MQPLRLERFGPLRLVGLMRSHHAAQDNHALFRVLSGQWSAYVARRAAATPPCSTYGVFGCMADGATHFDYFCGAPSAEAPPAGFVAVNLIHMRCAVFGFHDHLSGLRDFVGEIFRNQLPAAGLSLLPAHAGAPEFVERYGDDFIAASDKGGLEILIPVQD